MDSVHFDLVAPWPAGAAGTGASLQLIDPTRDSSRVANWAISTTNATPGATNSVRASLPSYPLVWLNEVQPNNVSGIKDASGTRGPWVELYNSSPDAIDLTGFYLSDSYTNLTRWAFPANSRIAANQYLIVWLDGRPANSTASELHTAFRIDQATGAIALVGLQNGQPAVFDYLSYSNPGADKSYGAFPNGQAVTRQVFEVPTPGAPNVGIVLTGLRLQAAFNAGNVTLTWNSDAGAAYQVQFKNALSDTAWQTLKTLTATSTATAVSDSVTGSQARFYRIVKQ